MTNEQAINILFNEQKCIDRNDGVQCNRECGSCDLVMDVETIREVYNMAISALQAQDVPDTNVDTIDRAAAIDFIDAGHLVNPNEPRWSDNEVVNFLKSRPSAQPYTEAELQKMQDLEQAEIQKAYELGREEGQKEAQPEHRWIPCKCELPEPYMEVLVSDDGIVYTALRTDVEPDGMRYKNFHWEDIESRTTVHPDAWMPLPEAYGGEQ